MLLRREPGAGGGDVKMVKREPVDFSQAERLICSRRYVGSSDWGCAEAQSNATPRSRHLHRNINVTSSDSLALGDFYSRRNLNMTKMRGYYEMESLHGHKKTRQYQGFADDASGAASPRLVSLAGMILRDGPQDGDRTDVPLQNPDNAKSATPVVASTLCQIDRGRILIRAMLGTNLPRR